MCAWIAQAAGAVIGTVGTIAANISGDKLRKYLDNAGASDPTYDSNQQIADRQGLANNLLNARMPGAATEERNIYGAQANNQAYVNRNATDSGQALALGAAGQAQTDQAMQTLGTQESQDYYNRLGNYNSATDASAAEGHYKNEQDVRHWQDLVNLQMARHAVRQQQGQNMMSLGSSIGSMGGGSAGGSGGGK